MTADDADVIERYRASEFALLDEAAQEAGIIWPSPAVSRIEDGPISAISWGTGDPDIVLLHGGGQNAHTWDTVVLALLDDDPQLSALAVDLPGHGRSAWRADGAYSPLTNAATLAPFLAAHAPGALAVIGMSLGGLTAIGLDQTGWRVPARMLVDVTPESGRRVAEMTATQRGPTALLAGPRTYPTFTDIVDAVTSASPGRSRTALRRGVLHNARVNDDGVWEWRYDALRPETSPEALWELVSNSPIPTTLVRGGNSVYTTDADVAELVRLSPQLSVTTVEGAGHSVQGDRPLELAAVIADFVRANGRA